MQLASVSKLLTCSEECPVGMRPISTRIRWARERRAQRFSARLSVPPNNAGIRKDARSGNNNWNSGGESCGSIQLDSSIVRRCSRWP